MHIVLFHFYSKKPNPVYQEISAALRRRGHTVWVGAPDENGDLVWEDGADVVARQAGPTRMPAWARRNRLIRPFAHRLAYFRFMWGVRQFLRRHRPDIAQINTSLFAWLLPLGAGGDTHYILDIRQINEAMSNSLPGQIKEQQLILTRQAFARYFYEHTCFCHRGAAERILGPTWPRRGSVVPVGVDEQFLDYDADRLARFQPGRPVRFIYVGTLSPIRNLERLMRAAQRLKARTTNFQLDFVGPDTANGAYHRMVDELGIGDVTAVKPPVPYEAIPDLLAGYDVGMAYVPDRPTWHYQPTIKVLEYRALGLPIISTDVASHREVVEAGKNGLLVADTEADLADAMHRFIADPDFLTAAQAHARQMRRGLTWTDVAGMYEENVYRRLLGMTAPSAKQQGVGSYE